MRARRLQMAVAGLLLTCAAGCQVKKPIVALHDVHVASVGLKEAHLLLDFRVINPNAFGATVQNFEYTFASGDRVIAEGCLPVPVEPIEPYHDRILQAPVTLRWGDLLAAGTSAVRTRTAPYRLTTHARFRVLGVSMQRQNDRTGEIALFRKPRWDIKWPRIHRNPWRLELVFHVTNPNDFDLSLAGLKGQLKYDGQTLLEVAEPAVRQLDPDATVEVVVPLRLRAEGVSALAMRLVRGKAELLQFDGDFELSDPVSLRKRLLESFQKDPP